MSGWRLAEGGVIDRGRPLAFGFDGEAFSGFAGDTLASALLASGVRVIGRSFKYHRPRGLWGFGGEEPNAIFDVTEDGATTPNVRATVTPLRAGMTLTSVNTWPDAARDRHRFADLAQRFVPAGFYYKTFKAPDWMHWEGMIRRMAGLGRLDPGNHPAADMPHVNGHCDILVIGAGPAGLAAARAAARGGAKVWLVDEAPGMGGTLRWRGGTIDGSDWHKFADDTLAAVESAGGRVFRNTTLWGAFDHGLFAAWERRQSAPDRHWRVRAGRTILAAGAIERPLWFADNDLPGIMSAEAALHYLRLYGVVAGRRIVLATGNDASYPVAAALAAAGADVTLADARTHTPDAPDGVRLLHGARLSRARGSPAVTAAVVDGAQLDADTVLVSGGYTPSVHLFAQAGGMLDWNEGADALVPRPGSAPIAVAGAANGGYGLATALAQGHAAADGCGPAPRAGPGGNWGLVAMRPNPALPGRQWIDLQNDVTLKDVALAAREGFVSVEHLKRYTTLGMATDQGRSANFAGLAVMAALTGRSIPETGTTTYRPPFSPVPLSVIGGLRRGELFNPVKRLALEDIHRARGARFREYGGWLRPAVYGANEAEAAQSEALAARQDVGLYDASPLGKIEVIGPDAADLLDFCGYVRLSTLKPGRARYGFMLGESGIVHDDGVVLRMAEDRFIVSASSSHASSVRLILEEARQDRFDPRRVFVHDVTANWVTLTVTGPRSRELLRAADMPGKIADDAVLPHMSVSETQWGGCRLRAARVSFTGDRSYELSASAKHGPALHAALEGARRRIGGRWIGLEALMILRAEKGYILIGKDTDGATMPHDLGWGSQRERRTDEYFGRRALFTPEAKRRDRRQLVGLETEGDTPLPTGAHLVPLEGPRRSLGFVTSSYFSPILARPIALAMVEAGQARMGEELGVFHLGALRTARIARACAFDPGGDRLDG